MCSSKAMTLAGTAIGAYSQVAAGNADAQAAAQNAAIAKAQAESALAQGRFQERAARRQTARLIGEQQARAAASGLDIGSGSAADLQAEAAYFGELDAQQIRTNAAMQAWGYNVQAKQFKQQARQARYGGILNAAGTLLGGAGSIYEMRARDSDGALEPTMAPFTSPLNKKKYPYSTKPLNLSGLTFKGY